jgi:hypothetical protein
MMKFDLHMHTSRHSPDSILDPFILLRRAKQVGLDGIVITEHDYLWPEEELTELRKAAPDLVVLAGIEISARDGDVLVYGVTDPFKLPRGIKWSALCDEIHRQGGVAVAAHPYRWGQDLDRIMREQKPTIDGLEMMSNNMTRDLREKTAEYHRKNATLATLGNSDAHDEDVVGCCYTEFDAEIRTIADLVLAIKSRKATPRKK